ncbi:MAG: 2,3-dehydroadipyl-CoA hydratase [Paracidovorax wautersii]|uniref:2,3-dehydroadipyl-CoA hydratase n=1 Tax=Paracidovorax wautersii TaxID=1177982 RepID=A0A7V8FR60_9BURK|nr:MAG: 2,3-dehydroadipyl-CoA hydratase [Paracidovorax wautersii]
MSDLLQDLTDGVLTLTFNRIDKKNSLTQAMYVALTEAFDRAASDSAVRVVVIQGDATVFCAGNDIGDFLTRSQAAASGAVDATSTDRPVFAFLHTLASFPKPLVAAVCGPAVGVGATMLLHCDLVYAGDNAAFSLPFVNLGVCPEAGSSLLLPQMLGYHRAAEALLLGEPFMAEAALEVGLVNRVLPPTGANAYAQAQARKLAAKSQASLIETKRLLKKSQLDAVQARIQEEGESFGRLMAGPAAREAFTAFMEKRKPDFSGL